MELALLPMVGSSGFLPSASLLESLIHICNEVGSNEKLPFIQVRNISTMIRRIELLSSLFEEIREINSAQLPPSSVLCLTELFSVIKRVKALIQGGNEYSCLWGRIQTEAISNQFYIMVKEMGKALYILPLSLLNITADIREQVELLHKQAKRVELFVDTREVQRREKLLHIMASNNEKNRKINQCFIDIETVKEVFGSIGLRRADDYDEEISKLEAEAQKQAGTGGLIVVSNISNLVSLVSYSKSMVFSREETDQKTTSQDIKRHKSSCSQPISSSNIPDEFVAQFRLT